MKQLGAPSSIEASPASWSALVHGRHLAYTALLTLGVGVHAVGIHLVATVLPSVAADLGGAAFYTWAIVLYTMASIMGTASGGLFNAVLDLRRGYLVGVLVELVGWAGCAVAPHIAVLLLARAIQGFGSWSPWPTAWSASFMPKPSERGCYQPSRAYGGWRHCLAPS
jgi:MFS family permease